MEPPLNPEDPDAGLVRRMRAIHKAADDANFDPAIVAAARPGSPAILRRI